MTLREFRNEFIHEPTTLIIDIQGFGQLMLTDFEYIHKSLLDRKVVQVCVEDCEFSENTEKYLVIVLLDED